LWRKQQKDTKKKREREREREREDNNLNGDRGGGEKVFGVGCLVGGQCS